jgi:hypothetical protein
MTMMMKKRIDEWCESDAADFFWPTQMDVGHMEGTNPITIVVRMKDDTGKTVDMCLPIDVVFVLAKGVEEIQRDYGGKDERPHN